MVTKLTQSVQATLEQEQPSAMERLLACLHETQLAPGMRVRREREREAALLALEAVFEILEGVEFDFRAQRKLHALIDEIRGQR